MMESIASIVERGPGAVLGFAFLAILYWILTRFTASLDRLTRASELHSAILLGLQAQLMTHDLTVSGLNPAAGADIDERTNRTYAKYVETLRQIEECRRLILSHLDGKGGK